MYKFKVMNLGLEELNVSKRINVGLIGVGGVGEVLLKAFQECNLTNVVGFYDTNLVRLEAVQSKYQVKAYHNYLSLIANQEVDLIYIGVPPKYHHSIALEVMKSGKHILCEKPLANSLHEAKELAEEANNRNRVYALNFPTIYRPAFKELEKILPKLGELRKIEVQCYFTEWPRSWQQNAWINSREQGGFIKEVFPHYIQMIQRLFGEFNLEYSSVTFPIDPELSETGITAIGSTESGIPVLFNALANIGQKEYLHFTLYGTEGTASLVNWRELWLSSKSGKEEVELPELNHLVELIEDVVNAIDGQTTDIVTFADGYEVQKILDSFYPE
jgi:predicted dehydrogenase